MKIKVTEPPITIKQYAVKYAIYPESMDVEQKLLTDKDALQGFFNIVLKEAFLYTNVLEHLMNGSFNSFEERVWLMNEKDTIIYWYVDTYNCAVAINKLRNEVLGISVNPYFEKLHEQMKKVLDYYYDFS
jgi:hypothetical protein